jgi:hypothetical protein
VSDGPAIDVRFTTVDPPAREFVLPHTPVSYTTRTTARWNRAQPLQFSGEILSYQGTRANVLQLPPISPHADTIEESQQIERTIATMRSLLYVPAASDRIGGLNRPQRVVLAWPNAFDLTLVLLDVTVARTRFFEVTPDPTIQGAARGWQITVQYVEARDERRTSEDVALGRDGFGRAQGRTI